jgi:hypothetical protein
VKVRTTTPEVSKWETRWLLAWPMKMALRRRVMSGREASGKKRLTAESQSVTRL